MDSKVSNLLSKILHDRERLGLSTSEAEYKELIRYAEAECQNISTPREQGVIYGSGSEGQDWFSERD